jgi:hypothetical protein
VRRNADASTLERALIAHAVLAVRDATHEPLDALPWDERRAPTSRRLFAALVSFVDDYSGDFPSELLPRDAAHALRHALRQAASEAPGRVLTIDEQFAVALDVAGGRAFAAAILLHAVTRLVARGRDERALGELEWEERLHDASWMAPFAPEIAGTGDAPGDTYHYWANVAVGMHAELRGTIIPHVVGAAFYVGPVAMRVVRQGVFGSHLFAGAHALCDRMGLRHGRMLACALRAHTREESGK